MTQLCNAESLNYHHLSFLVVMNEYDHLLTFFFPTSIQKNTKKKIKYQKFERFLKTFALYSTTTKFIQKALFLPVLPILSFCVIRKERSSTNWR